MNRETLDKKLILNTYLENKDKGKYWVAKHLKLNKNSVCALIDKYNPNNVSLNIELEEALLKIIKLYPYTGTKHKLSNILKTTSYSIEQVLHKTKNIELINYFTTPKSHCSKLTDKDIQDILDGSKLGIGNDLMGIQKGIDGVSIRNIRKKFLTSEEYEKYHSINRFYEGDYNSYYNERGDKFLSTWEEKVADFLYHKNIKYYSNVRLDYKSKHYSPDIYIPENRVFIEIFGMSNINCYKGNMNKKSQYYIDNKIKCLFLYEEDFLENRKPIEKYKIKLNEFLEEIKNIIFNNHIKNNIVFKDR
jgi:hypothetical protein